MYLAIFAPLLFAGLSFVSTQDSQPPEHVIELYVVVDKQAQNNIGLWGRKMTIKDLVAYDVLRMVDEINNYLSTLMDNNLNLKVQLNGFEMVTGERTVVPKKTITPQGQLKTKHSLGLLNTFLKSKIQVTYDIGMLLTGHALVKDGVAVDAVSTESKVCQTGLSGLAVIQTSNTQEMAWRATREIAKILGAKVQDKPGCDGYLMSSNKFGKNRWDISKCTAKIIRDTLDKLSANKVNCLGPADNKTPTTLKTMGLSESVDNIIYTKVCKKTFWTAQPHVCEYHNGVLIESDEMCSGGMSCKTNGKCTRIPAPEGALCKEKMICKRGKCVPRVTEPELDCGGRGTFGECCHRGNRHRCTYDKVFLKECCTYCTEPIRSWQNVGGEVGGITGV